MNTATPLPVRDGRGRPGLMPSWSRSSSAELQAGEPVDLEALAGHDPERAEQLRQLLPALEMLADLGRSVDRGIRPASPPAPERSRPGAGHAGRLPDRSARSAAAAWASSTRPSSSRSAAGWR